MSAVPADNGGFSIIEVLVALAIASFVLVGLAGIVSLVATAQGRSADAGAILHTLINTQALTSQLGEYRMTVDSVSADAVGFAGGFIADLTVAISLSDDQQLAVKVDGQTHALIDLSMFDHVSLQGFARTGTTYTWSPLSATATEPPVLVRLLLVKAHRVWSVVLWGLG